MADDRLREYYDAQQPSEALMERLRAMEAPPAKPRRRALPIAAAAVLALVLAAAFWPKAEPGSTPEPALEAADAAPETPAPTAVPTVVPTAPPTIPPTAPPVSLAVPTPAPPQTPRTTMIIPSGTGASLPPEEGDVPGMVGEADVSAEYLLEDGRHLVHIWFPDGEERTLDLTDLLVDGHFEGEVDAGDMYIDVFLTVYDDGTADLSIGGIYPKGEER